MADRFAAHLAANDREHVERLEAIARRLSGDLKLALAAQRWCDARDQERAIVAALKPCERRRRFLGHGEDGPEFWEPAELNEGEAMCSRAMVPYQTSEGFDYEPLPEAKWCQSCRDNMPAVVELRRVRKQIPGFASALRRTGRACHTDDLTDTAQAIRDELVRWKRPHPMGGK